MRRVFEAVLEECARQDTGGDCEHGARGWVALLANRVGKLYDCESAEDYRRRLIQVAAVAFRAVEWVDYECSRHVTGAACPSCPEKALKPPPEASETTG